MRPLTCFLVAVGTVLACEHGTTIPNSNRDAGNPCAGGNGTQCAFTCNGGYIAVGRHVCQTYSTNGVLALNHTFFGGSCRRLCGGGDPPCGATEVPLRHNSSDAAGECLATTCMASQEAALLDVAQGAYAVWKMAYNPASGLYVDHINMTAGATQDWTQGALGPTGLGVVAESVAHAMNWTTLEEAQARVMLTLQSLAGETPGVKLNRNHDGWSPTFMDSTTGGTSSTKYSTLATGLNAAGVLFGKTYFRRVAPSSPATATISRLADKVVGLVNWPTLLCNTSNKVDVNGTGLPMVVDDAGNCQAVEFPESDGFYQFFELHYTVWLTYSVECGAYAAGACPNKAVETMWNKWQGRATLPNHAYGPYPLLSEWSCYIVHLPYYVVHAFNSDPNFTKLFTDHWLADWAYFNSSTYSAGTSGRYGMGAGPTEEWCSGTGYIADRIRPYGDQGCRMYSPYCLAGYLPAAPSTISSHLTDLMRDGDTVLPVPETDHHILWRKSLLDSSWPGVRVTMVDFSDELFGLATLFLGTEFFQSNTNHFDQ